MVVLMERCSPARRRWPAVLGGGGGEEETAAALGAAAALGGGGGPRGQRLLGPPSSLWMVLQWCWSSPPRRRLGRRKIRGPW